jgi:ribosome biogenesis ATPase
MSGESEKKVRDIFEEAKQNAPCLMFIDEIDAITQKRETAQREMERRIVAQMLTCMDGNTSINRSKAIPACLLRLMS